MIQLLRPCGGTSSRFPVDAVTPGPAGIVVVAPKGVRKPVAEVQVRHTEGRIGALGRREPEAKVVLLAAGRTDGPTGVALAAAAVNVLYRRLM